MKGTLYIVWSKDNETKIPIIDEQHRAIVSTINSLFYFMQEKRALEALTPLLTMLSQYTKIHFDTEESLMKKAGYADFNDHQSLHRELIKETAAVMRRSTDEKNPAIVLAFLKDWWLNHINMEDRKYMEAVGRHLGLDDSEE